MRTLADTDPVVQALRNGIFLYFSFHSQYRRRCIAGLKTPGITHLYYLTKIILGHPIHVMGVTGSNIQLLSLFSRDETPLVQEVETLYVKYKPTPDPWTSTWDGSRGNWQTDGTFKLIRAFPSILHHLMAGNR